MAPTARDHFVAATVTAVMVWAGIVGTPVFDLVGGGGAPDAGEEFGGIGPEDLKLPFVFWLNREVRMPLVAVIGPPQKLFRIRQAWHLYRDGPSVVRRLEVRVDGELRYRSEDPAYRWRTGILDNRRVRPVVSSTVQKAGAKNAAGLTRLITGLARADFPTATEVTIACTRSKFPGTSPKVAHGWVARAPAWTPEALP